ncbi:hypothetical protein PYH37_001327 [Sinorhizobium numidicum]|uniref:Transmembrane protein n=2 Tax=Sinorhizobium numidicum TaxID=680248 RepID=A0ABY8CXK2_9HYPH|nr:hypothetical protein [Sinorhizobium numidicum]WEX75676.1 hypothetical protein PYH37_001327 [Sinorhizobium numidicum]WEX81671.1 hypothetical protein PYH38_001328 [Sinorhizobium numidicum]
MKDAGNETPIARAILFLLIGPISWGGHFFLVYAFQSVTCALRGGNYLVMSPAVVAAGVILLTLVFALLLLLALRFPRPVARMLRYAPSGKDNQEFSIHVAQLLIVLSLVGVVWTGTAVLLPDACGQLR